MGVACVEVKRFMAGLAKYLKGRVLHKLFSFKSINFIIFSPIFDRRIIIKRFYNWKKF